MRHSTAIEALLVVTIVSAVGYGTVVIKALTEPSAMGGNRSGMNQYDDNRMGDNVRGDQFNGRGSQGGSDGVPDPGVGDGHDGDGGPPDWMNPGSTPDARMGGGGGSTGDSVGSVPDPRMGGSGGGDEWNTGESTTADYVSPFDEGAGLPGDGSWSMESGVGAPSPFDGAPTWESPGYPSLPAGFEGDIPPSWGVDRAPAQGGWEPVRRPEPLPMQQNAALDEWRAAMEERLYTAPVDEWPVASGVGGAPVEFGGTQSGDMSGDGSGGSTGGDIIRTQEADTWNGEEMVQEEADVTYEDDSFPDEGYGSGVDGDSSGLTEAISGWFNRWFGGGESRGPSTGSRTFLEDGVPAHSENTSDTRRDDTGDVSGPTGVGGTIRGFFQSLFGF